MYTLIKGLKEIVSLYEYCEANGLIYPEDTELFCNINDVEKEDDVEVEKEIDRTSLNEIFVELWLRKLTNQIKKLDNVKWDKSSEGAFIQLADGGYILVQYMLDDRLCFGMHDTLHIEYMEKKELNQDLLSKIIEIIKAKPKTQKRRIAVFEVKTERVSSFWSTNPSELCRPAKITSMLSEIVKTMSKGHEKV